MFVLAHTHSLPFHIQLANFFLLFPFLLVLPPYMWLIHSVMLLLLLLMPPHLLLRVFFAVTIYFCLRMKIGCSVCVERSQIRWIENELENGTTLFERRTCALYHGKLNYFSVIICLNFLTSFRLVKAAISWAEHSITEQSFSLSFFHSLCVVRSFSVKCLTPVGNFWLCHTVCVLVDSVIDDERQEKLW